MPLASLCERSISEISGENDLTANYTKNITLISAKTLASISGEDIHENYAIGITMWAEKTIAPRITRKELRQLMRKP